MVQKEPSSAIKLEEKPKDEMVSSCESTQEDGLFPVSDLTVFKYCLGGLADRAVLLKDVVAATAPDQLLSAFAHHVALYSGCSHHRRQIIIAKSLIEDGTRVWNLIAHRNRLQWDEAVLEIAEQFKKISCCSARSLTKKDFELLKSIAGCGEYMALENFEKMWCWLYPIAITLSRDTINRAWSSVSPKWIEGFITKEEAEMSLQGPLGMQVPGTFILRFPTSRSWPHPDAGSLIVTYVGHDYTIHHRLLSLDYFFSCTGREKNAKTLEEMLSEDPALSRLGRTTRTL